jgi:hypothetical protein
MRLKLIVQNDGHDAERLTKLLNGGVLGEVLDETVKHLYWWGQTVDGAQQKILGAIVDLITDQLASRGFEVTDWDIYGQVKMLDGRLVEKSEQDLGSSKTS